MKNMAKKLVLKFGPVKGLIFSALVHSSFAYVLYYFMTQDIVSIQQAIVSGLVVGYFIRANEDKVLEGIKEGKDELNG